MENKKIIKKSFFVHQYEEEEKFLSKMHSEGWAFKSLHMGLPTKYEFEKCTPENYIYQLDYIPYDNDTEDYHKLFSDSGWEEIMSWPAAGGKWYYFRRRSDENAVKIYTDAESKLQMVDNLQKKYSFFFIIAIFIEFNAIWSSINLLNREDSPFFWNIADIIIILLGIFVICVSIWQIVSLNIYKEKIKSREKIHF